MGIIMKNGVCYSNGGDINIQPVIYSDTEREVGVWRDGKPLYQKTVYYVGGQSGNVSFNHNIANIDMPVKVEGVATDNEMANTFQLIPRSDKDGNIVMTAEVNRTQITYAVSQAFSTRIVNLYFTVWYTKTTDTAGSGTWTPSGVPAVHYSTDEQVVGTWVDGKTLYQKTLTYQNIQFNSSGYCDIDLSTENTSLILAVYDASYYIWTYNSVELRRSFERIAVEDDHVLLIGPASRNIDDAYVTIRYTKITTP